MKTKITIGLLSFFFSFICSAQQTLTLQPDALTGKDAMIHGLNTLTNNNFGNDEEFLIAAWTWSGVAGATRSIIEFDLSQIPANSTISNAKLSLYARDVDAGSGFHSDLSGSNDFYIKRITSNWSESTVTWNTMPSTSSTNCLSVPGTSNPQQDYLDIDVTLLVKDMLLDMNHSFGFMMQLQNENYYRKMNFCSTDHINQNLHPKLVITYQSAASIGEINMDKNLRIFPNPSNDNISIKGTSNYMESTYAIIDNLGKEISKGIISNELINIENLSKGMYVLKIEGENPTFLNFVKN